MPFIQKYFVFLVGDHVEVVIGEFYVLGTMTDVKVFNEFISANDQHIILFIALNI